MAQIRPFRAVRPIPELADRVAALPYDVMSSDEARRMVDGNPYSFLHVDKAEIDLAPILTCTISGYMKSPANIGKDDSGGCLHGGDQALLLYLSTDHGG